MNGAYGKSILQMPNHPPAMIALPSSTGSMHKVALKSAALRPESNEGNAIVGEDWGEMTENFLPDQSKSPVRTKGGKKGM
jgi:hypothetical protein